MALIYRAPYARYVRKYVPKPVNEPVSADEREKTRARVRKLGMELFGGAEE